MLLQITGAQDKERNLTAPRTKMTTWTFISWAPRQLPTSTHSRGTFITLLFSSTGSSKE